MGKPLEYVVTSGSEVIRPLTIKFGVLKREGDWKPPPPPSSPSLYALGGGGGGGWEAEILSALSMICPWFGPFVYKSLSEKTVASKLQDPVNL